MNAASTEEVVRRIEIEGSPYLFYRGFPLNIALVRGTTADPDGNVSLEDEALNHGLRSIAAAVHNHGGKVIVQVKRRVANGTLTGRQIHLPACLVDAVVLAEDPSDTGQTFVDYFNPTFCGDMRVENNQIPVMPLGDRKVIARRAALELLPRTVINLGIGMPEGVASVASEEGLSDLFTLTTEAGVIGGVPCSGVNFGVSYNPEAFFSLADQFDFYDGGGLDAAFLGLAQVGPDGSLNVSRFGNRIPGFGGFVNISQNARKVVFMGTFTAGGLAVEVADGALRIAKEGRFRKFVNRIEQISFNGEYAAQQGAHVLYVTERCVFRLVPEGLELAEVAPGINIARDILPAMDFSPVIRNPKPMDPRIFRDAPMGLTAAELAARNG
jgi:propionate CoA-transferase